MSACRSDGKRGASVRIFRRAPSGRKNEASIRCRFTVSVLRIATSDGRAPTIRAIGSRNVSSYVNHGSSGREPALDAEMGPPVEQRLHRRSDALRLESQRVAGQVDRGRPVGSLGAIGEQEPVAIDAERVGGVERERLRLGRHGQRMVSWPSSASSRASSTLRRQPGQVADRRHGRGPARVRLPERRREVLALEPRGDEPGTERVAGPDRVHDRSGRRGPGSTTGSPPRSRATRAVGAELHDRERWAQVQHGLRQGGRIGVGRRRSGPRVHRGYPRTTSDRSASGRRTGAAASSDHRRRRRLTSKLTVIFDSLATSMRKVDRRPGRVGQRGRDAGQVEPAALAEHAVGLGAPHVVGRHARAGGAGPRVDHLGGPEHAAFPEHQAGRGARIDLELADVDAFAPKATDDRGAEAVATDAPDVERPSDRVARARPRHSPRRPRSWRSNRAASARDPGCAAISEMRHSPRVTTSVVVTSSGPRGRPPPRPRPGGPGPVTPAGIRVADEPAAEPDGDRAGRDERAGRLGGDPTGRHDRDVGERARELADEARAERRGREELHGGRAGSPGGQDLGRGRGAGECRDPAFGRPGDELGVGVRHDQERGPGIDGVPGGLDREHRPGTDRQAVAARPAGDRLDRAEARARPAR